MKIALGVHGRFHAFDLARALLARGHDLTLFTNYPKWIISRFGLPRRVTRSYWLHGGLSRALHRVCSRGYLSYPESALHPMFGRWLCGELLRESWDIVYLWSGVAEESLSSNRLRARRRLLVRGSAHIAEQATLLRDEQQRADCVIDQPSAWIIQREEREYALADRIVVLSSFAQRTFTARGVDPLRVRVLSLGAEVETFRPSPRTVRCRQERIRAGKPIRVLFVGAMTFRKGLHDLTQVVKELSDERFEFRLVGPATREARSALEKLKGRVEIFAPVNQRQLPRIYDWGDVFLFPTIEDGFAVVLGQARAAALPILTTPNCSGPDVVDHGKNGWIVPIRSPESLVERLRWCDLHRERLASMVSRAYERYEPRDWSDVARDFEAFCKAELGGAASRATNRYRDKVAFG